MDKEVLKKLIDEDRSQRDIATILNTSQTNIKYWLNKFELKTKYSTEKDNLSIIRDKKCNCCHQIQPISNFYRRNKNSTSVQHVCKACQNKRCVERVRDIKKEMVDYKGNFCNDCKLNVNDSHYCVFEFHHLDPKEKDPNFSKIKYKNIKLIYEELDKCVLLCSNCHRIRHYGLN